VQITIGLPFFNNRRTLPLAIRSIFAQTRTDWNLIVVDDGSRDGSRELLQRIRDPRVRLIANSDNRGLPVRLNEIARLADGEYLARMDADDAMHPDRLSREAAVLDADPFVDMVHTQAFIIDGMDVIRGLGGTTDLPERPVTALRHDGWIHPTVMARTSWFLRNPYDERMTRSQDFDLWCRTYPTSTFRKLAEPLLFYREVGVFHLANYLRMKTIDEDIYRRYGPTIVGPFRTQMMVVGARAKGALYRVLSAVGAENALVRRRSKPIDAGLARRGTEILNAVRATPVPGWSADTE
jgi:glycosyltransferase involved in cell wall biosynthesis